MLIKVHVYQSYCPIKGEKHVSSVIKFKSEKDAQEYFDKLSSFEGYRHVSTKNVSCFGLSNKIEQIVFEHELNNDARPLLDLPATIVFKFEYLEDSKND
jgi:hypothetical protein